MLNDLTQKLKQVSFLPPASHELHEADNTIEEKHKLQLQEAEQRHSQALIECKSTASLVQKEAAFETAFKRIQAFLHKFNIPVEPTDETSLD